MNRATERRGCGGIVVGWLLSGCLLVGGIASAHPGLPAVQAALPAQSDAIFVARRGWHIDIGFAAQDLVAPLHSLVAGFPGVRYLLIGFGDRHYLTAKHRGAPVMLRALWPGPGMLLVTALRTPPAAAFGAAHVVGVTLPREAVLRIQSFVWQALSDAAQSAVLAAANGMGPPAGVPGPYLGSVFLESRDRYSAAHTCNTWVAEALGAAGMPIHSRRVMFAGQLWKQVKSMREQEDAAAAVPLKPSPRP